MTKAYLFQQWQSLIEHSVRPFVSASLVSTDGELLFSKYQSLSDIGTMPVAALTCQQFFRLKPGDVVIINDPYSGGSLLSSINLVAGVSFEPQQKSMTADALLVIRIPFKPRVSLASSVEMEGVRIPPTPLMNSGQLNREILDAICSHPLAPKEMKTGLEVGLQQMVQTIRELARIKALTGTGLNKKLIKEWLDLATKRYHELLTEISHGTAKAEINLSSKSRLALAIEVKDGRISFNFTGSGPPDRYALSDSATLGACVGAVAAALNGHFPINGGLMRAVEIIAPLGSMVHARYPSPVFMGFTDGTAIVASLILKLLGQIDKKLLLSQSGLGSCAFELEFEDGRFFFDDLEPGGPANRDRKGPDALDIWRRTHLQRSIEMIERLYPLKIRSVALRSQSGGSGLHGGGDGQTKVIEVLAPCKIRWNMTKGPMKAEGAMGGKSAMGSEILYQPMSSDRISLEEFGELALSAGDQIIIHSGGGGGFGEAPPEA